MNYWQPAIVALRATYLPAYKAAVIYVPIRHLATGNCRLSTVLSPLHLSRVLYKFTLFMQNKPNFDKGQNKPNPLYKKDLRKFYTPSNNEKRTQNEPNSNPIKPNLLDAQMNITSVLTKDYENKPRFQTPQKQSQTNPISNPAPLTLARVLKAKEIRMTKIQNELPRRHGLTLITG